MEDPRRQPGSPAAQVPVLASYRPTLWQALAHGARLGAIVGALAAAVAGLVAVALEATDPGLRAAGGWALASLGALLLGLPLGGLVGVLVLRGIGVDVDELGMNRVPPRPPGRIAWAEIADLRAERRGRRVEVRAYLADGGVVRLPAPYDGPLLANDAAFDRHFRALRQIWRTRRRGHAPTSTG
jgi:hypothetical protein